MKLQTNTVPSYYYLIRLSVGRASMAMGRSGWVLDINPVMPPNSPLVLSMGWWSLEPQPGFTDYTIVLVYQFLYYKTHFCLFKLFFPNVNKPKLYDLMPVWH